SCAVSMMLKAVPAVCVPMLPPPAASTRNFANTPGFTSNALLVPVAAPRVGVAVAVFTAPACVPVPLRVRPPPLNAPEVAGVIVPAVVLRSTVPVKLVTVLLLASCAVIVMLNADPAVCGLLIVAMANFVGAPGLTSNALLVPVAAVFGAWPVAVMLKLPVFEMVTVWEASTPLAKFAVVPPPADNVPVELMVTCPVKP